MALTPILACAAASDSGSLADRYFSGSNPVLTAQEKAAITMAEKWRNAGPTGMKPVRGPDGAIRFLFGAQQPSIVCAVMQVCDVELQTGEQVNSIHIGDSARWNIEPAITGTRLLRDSAQAQQIQLDRFKSQLEETMHQWSADIAEKSEQILNNSIAVSEELIAKIIEGNTSSMSKYLTFENHQYPLFILRLLEQLRYLAVLNISATVIVAIFSFLVLFTY